MNYLTHNLIGNVHLFSALAALMTGTMILCLTKGTLLHRRVGYAYAASMIILNGTAFCIYRLFGKFGPFHYAALLSLATLLTGFIPIVFRKLTCHWLAWHAAGMYYSVIGLYAALCAEIVTRIPGLPFFRVVMLATFIVTSLGVLIFNLKRKAWMKLR